MPRPGIRLLGIVAACVLTGCAAANEANAPLPTPTPSPTPASVARLNWSQDLVFSGDLTGRVLTIVPIGPGQQSECSGVDSARGGRWDSAIYGQLPAGVFGLLFTATPYRGPGTYSGPAATVQVHSLDSRRVWRSVASDPVTLVVASDEESGTLVADLTNQVDNTSKLHVTGSWSCGR